MKVIITGATGMVGEGVLHVCLDNPDITQVLVINRKPYGMTHPKLKEIIHTDFFDFSAIEDQLGGYDACYFCLGITSVGATAEHYFKMTYSLTLYVGRILAAHNPEMVFCYVSGAGTDSAEKGHGWAAVKGKTENDLMKLFKRGYAFRPGFIKPIPGMKHTHSFYKYVNWMFPIGRTLYPTGFCKLTELANAMICVTQNGYEKHVLEGKDIIKLGTARG